MRKTVWAQNSWFCTSSDKISHPDKGLLSLKAYYDRLCIREEYQNRSQGNCQPKYVRLYMSEAMLEFLASMSGLLAGHLPAEMLEHMSENTRLVTNFAVAFAATGLRKSCHPRRTTIPQYEQPGSSKRGSSSPAKSPRHRHRRERGENEEGDEQEEEKEEEEGEWKGDAGITSGDPLLRGGEKINIPGPRNDH